LNISKRREQRVFNLEIKNWILTRRGGNSKLRNAEKSGSDHGCLGSSRIGTV
jgi:hypothetical protein